MPVARNAGESESWQKSPYDLEEMSVDTEEWLARAAGVPDMDIEQLRRDNSRIFSDC